MGKKTAIILLLSTSFLFALGSPDFLAPFFSLFFLIPSCIVYLFCGVKKIFLVSLFQWTLAYGIANIWFLNTFISIYKVNIIISFMLFLLCAVLFYGIYNAIFSMVTYLFLKKLKNYMDDGDTSKTRIFFIIIGIIVITSSLWGVIEYCRGLITPGFNITTLSSFFYRFPFLIQMINFTGEHLFSALIVSINLMLFFAAVILLPKSFLKVRTMIPDFSGIKNIYSVFLSLSLFFIIGLSIFASYHIGNIHFPQLESNSIMVVQANIPSQKKWKRQYYEEILQRYISFIENNRREGTRLVIWPETAINFYPQLDSPLSRRIIDYATQNSFTVIVGAPEYIQNGSSYQYFNAIFRIGDGIIRSIYRKERLVPFAEYCPVDWLYPIFRQIISDTQFSSFNGNEPIEVNGIRYSFAICFESTFPDLIENRTADSDVLIILSDDIWLGDTAGPQQHLATMVLRAIENRIWIISAVNSGVSAVISPRGEIIHQIGFGTDGVIHVP